MTSASSNAIWFYTHTKRGDIAQVVNTIGATLPRTDGLGHWNIPRTVAGRQRQHLRAASWLSRTTTYAGVPLPLGAFVLHHHVAAGAGLLSSTTGAVLYRHHRHSHHSVVTTPHHRRLRAAACVGHRDRIGAGGIEVHLAR